MGDANPPKLKILAAIPFPAPKHIVDKITKKHPSVDFIFYQIAFTHKPLPNNIPDELWKEIDILVTFNTLPPKPELAPNLRFIHFFSAGTNHVADTPIYQDSDIPLTSSSGIHGPQIAEWVVLQILSNSHKQKLLLDWQKEHKWGTHAEFGTLRDLVGQRLGVLGYGSIGRQAARVGKSLGLDIYAFTASPRPTPESKKDKGYIVPTTGDPDGTLPSAWYSGLDKASLHDFLSQDLDILLISVPLTDVTHHFIGNEEFEILGKRNTFIINIARGAVIVQDDLISALKKPEKEGGLRGAALDVTEPEPLNKESELWDLENVAITPHVSSVSTTYVDRSFEILEINLTNLEKGRKLLNLVDRKKGY